MILLALTLIVQKTPPSYPGYRLVWDDEFAVDGAPDPAKWGFEHGFVRNNESQWYQPDNARVEHGRLIIEARRERVANPDYDPASSDWKRSRAFAEYTSSCLETRHTQTWTYGRFEVSARFDPSSGLWPAIWFLGAQGHWPLNGGIDLMEFYRSTLLANSVFGNHQWNTKKVPIQEFLDRDSNWSKKFHRWRMDWDEHFIRLYVDGRLMNETDVGKTINPDGTNPFHAPMFMLLNLAIGSTGGDPSKTEFPARIEFEYVRVYQPT